MQTENGPKKPLCPLRSPVQRISWPFMGAICCQPERITRSLDGQEKDFEQEGTEDTEKRNEEFSFQLRLSW